MTEADVLRNSYALLVGTAKRQVFRQPAKQTAVDRCAVQIHDSDKPAHVSISFCVRS